MNIFARLLIISGIILIIAGLVFQLAPKFPWIGRLPGDIYIKKENFAFYFPISTSIIISVILSFIFYFLGRR